MVWVAILYAALGSLATHLVGRALIDINFDLQRYGAEFRFRMIAYARTRRHRALWRGSGRGAATEGGVREHLADLGGG